MPFEGYINPENFKYREISKSKYFFFMIWVYTMEFSEWCYIRKGTSLDIKALA